MGVCRSLLHWPDVLRRRIGFGSGHSGGYRSRVAPEMEKSGYDKAFTGAVITASGPLGILIPPSILMVVYGVVTGTSIGALLMAGIDPYRIWSLFDEL